MINDYNTLSNQLNSALNTNQQQDYSNIQLMAQQGILGLRQLSKFNITTSFKDSDGKTWKLVKSANDSSVEIPDRSYVQITDYWKPSHDRFYACATGKLLILSPRLMPGDSDYERFHSLNDLAHDI